MNIIKIAAAFTAGIAVGCFGTYMYMKKYVVDPEYIDVVPTDEDPEEEEKEEPTEEKVEVNPVDMKPGTIYPSVEEGGTPEEKEDEIIEVEADEEESSYPYEITMEEYLNSKKEYEKVVCQLYIHDETLVADEITEDQDGELMDHHSTIGDELFDKFVNANEDLQYMWVRNDKNSADYEVCRNEASYKRLMGLEE